MPTEIAACAAGLVMLVLVLLHPGVLADGDTYSHIAAGGWMLDHHAILRSDPFSATRAGAPWVAHEWLAEILLAGAWRGAGWAGVVALTAAAAGAAFWQMGRHLGRWLPWQAVLCLLVLAAACVAPGLLARPHILALPALEAWVAGLLMARAAGRAPPWWLLGVMVVWANLHGGFIIGLALVVPLAAEALVEAPAQWRAVGLRWGAFLAAAVAASLATPHGLAGLTLGFRMAGMAGLSHVSEWQPADFSTLTVLELLILIGLYMGLGRGARLPPLRLAIVLGLLHLALQHARHLMLIGMIVPLLVAGPLGAALLAEAGGGRPAAGARWRRGVPAAGLAVAALMLAARLAVPVVRVDGPTAPIAALAHVPAALRAEPVLNDYAFGGYLIFEGVRPYIDARAELYGPEALAAYAALVRPDRGVLQAALHDGRIGWTMLAVGNPAAGEMDSLPGWCRLYADGVAVIHRRCG